METSTVITKETKMDLVRFHSAIVQYSWFDTNLKFCVLSFPRVWSRSIFTILSFQVNNIKNCFQIKQGKGMRLFSLHSRFVPSSTVPMRARIKSVLLLIHITKRFLHQRSLVFVHYTGKPTWTLTASGEQEMSSWINELLKLQCAELKPGG